MALTESQRLAAQERLRYDTPFWAGGVTRDSTGAWQPPGPGKFHGCVKIINKQRQLVPLIARPWQLELDEALEKQRAVGLPMRALILKARRLGMCCDPATRVLTADMRWERMDEIEVGQQVVSTDEEIPGGRGRARKMRAGVVEAKREVREEAYLLRFDDGRTLVATGPHRWLCRRRGGTEANWRTVSDMQVGDYVRHITTPWEPGDHEDGWFGGFIDGEGCLAKKADGGGDLCVSQREGEVLERGRDYLRARGYTFREETSRREAPRLDNLKLVLGRTNEIFQLIGQTRPTRFVNETRWWADRDLPGKKSGVAWAKVVEIRPLGKRRMIDLQTDRKTFIAEGFVSHNSTWVAMKFLQRVTQLPYQRAVVMAQDVDTAGYILDMAKTAYAHLPGEDQLGLGFAIKPALIGVSESKNGRKHMVFGEPSKALRVEGKTELSSFEIDTAGSPTSGRGTEPNLLHGSEVAFWEAGQAMNKLLAMLEAVPYEPETIVVLESTANGLNHWHRRWVNARTGAADPDSGEVYVPIFVPWWRDPDCSRRFATDDARARFEESIGDTGRYGELAEDEPMLVELYGATSEQLLWRRMKIAEQPDKSVQTFNQENPHSDEAAFIGSGRTVFSGILIAKAIAQTKKAPAPVLGALRASDWLERRSRAGTVRVPLAPVWVPADRAKPNEHLLEVWEHPRKAGEAPPQPDGRPASEFERREGAYVLSCDVAGGEANTIAAGDYHVVKVFDWHTRTEVANHASRMDLHLLPLWVLLVALYFNEARMAIEVNNQGIAVVDPLGKDYRYRRMYRRERIDVVTKERTNKPGWETNHVTKPAMEGTFGALLDSDLRGGLRDLATARELATYVVTERGKHEAQPGEYDDRLMAAMIAQQVMAMRRPPKIGGKRVEGFRATDPLTGY